MKEFNQVTFRGIVVFIIAFCLFNLSYASNLINNLIISISDSNELHEQAFPACISENANYIVYNLLDNDNSTCWIIPTKDTTLRITFAAEVLISKVDVLSGYEKNEKLYFANNRPSVIVINGQSYKLKDATGVQSIKLNNKTSELIMTFPEVYKGTIYNDTCISEIKVYGTGPKVLAKKTYYSNVSKYPQTSKALCKSWESIMNFQGSNPNDTSWTELQAEAISGNVNAMQLKASYWKWADGGLAEMLAEDIASIIDTYPEKCITLGWFNTSKDGFLGEYCFSGGNGELKKYLISSLSNPKMKQLLIKLNQKQLDMLLGYINSSYYKNITN